MWAKVSFTVCPLRAVLRAVGRPRASEEYGTVFWKMSGIAYTLESLDEKEHGLVLMFDEILQKAFEMDPGLNHDIEYLVLDLDGFKTSCGCTFQEKSWTVRHMRCPQPMRLFLKKCLRTF